MTIVETVTPNTAVVPDVADKKRPVRSSPGRETAFGCARDFMDNRFVYSVVSPRARGLAIGVNMNPDMLCNYDCLYCEVNRSLQPRETKLNVDVMREELQKTLAFVGQGRLRERPWYQTLPAELLQLR